MHRALQTAVPVAVTALTLVAGGCSASDQNQAGSLERGSALPSVSSGLDKSGASTLPELPAAAVVAATAWATAVCGWPQSGANDVRALMTATAADAWSDSWSAATDTTTATCTDLAVAPLEGPDTASTRYVLVTADRTVVGADGSVTGSLFVEPRRMVEADGRWLVDVRVEGG